MQNNEMMKIYIEDFMKLGENISIFKKQIEIFSKFLEYTNPNYKYNGTYLGQYIADFECVYESLKLKKDKYMDIFITVYQICLRKEDEKSEEKFDFEVYIDGTFKGAYINGRIENGYIVLNKDKITNDSVEVKIVCIVDKNNIKKEYTFCKEYNLEENLDNELNSDVERYMKNMREREIKR